MMLPLTLYSVWPIYMSFADLCCYDCD